MPQTDKPGLVQLSVARAGLLLAVAPLLAMHNTSKVQGGKTPIIPLPKGSWQPELSFKILFPLSIKRNRI